MKRQNYPWIKNPMTIIALFVGLTEIGFGIAFSKIPANLQIYFVLFLILFPSLCAIGFFVILFFRPHHFYGPSDFRNDESYVAINKRIDGIKSFIAITNDKKAALHPNYDNKEILSAIINNLDEGVCWFFLRARGKALTFMELLEILEREKGDSLDEDRMQPTIQPFLNRIAMVSYMRCLGDNFLNFIYRLRQKPNDKLVLEISDEAAKLIKQKLGLD
jgi:hypothetical protein